MKRKYNKPLAMSNYLCYKAFCDMLRAERTA
jgi:hypothetical protein